MDIREQIELLRKGTLEDACGIPYQSEFDIEVANTMEKLLTDAGFFGECWREYNLGRPWRAPWGVSSSKHRKIREQIERLRHIAKYDVPTCQGWPDIENAAGTLERLLAALQDIVDYHQDYHAPMNKDFDAIQDIAMGVLRDIDDPAQTRRE